MGTIQPTVERALFDAAQRGDLGTLRTLLDQHPAALHARNAPYEWTLLHVAAHAGHVTIVDLLLALGLDPNTREKGDNSCAMHWAAAAGHADVVLRLADAGGDVTGHGDDHELEVIGWATCWDGCDDDAHRAVVNLLLERGAAHNIHSAIAMGHAGEVRRIVSADPQALERPMSHNEAHQRPLHFAVRKNLGAMVALLLELGADSQATDEFGATATDYAASPDVDRSLLEMLARRAPATLFTALALDDTDTASRLLQESPGLIEASHGSGSALHLLAKRGDVRAVQWLLAHGAKPNAMWSHGDAEVTAMHLAAWMGHAEVVRSLLDHGADSTIHDSKHDSDVLGWAEHGGRSEVVEMLRMHRDGMREPPQAR